MSRLTGIALSILALPILLAPEALAAPADKLVRFEARTHDLDLRTEAGVHHLAQRILDRMQAICGTASDANLRVVMTGEGWADYRACTAKLALAGNASAPVKDAFARALKQMR